MIEAEIEHSLARLEALARLMDGAFVLPGTDIRLGLDALIGLIPGVGDAISAAISSYLIWEARRLGIPKWLMARMFANIAMDTVIGAIPVAGDVFDVMFRANVKNRRHLEKKGYRASRGGGPVIDGEYTRVR